MALESEAPTGQPLTSKSDVAKAVAEVRDMFLARAKAEMQKEEDDHR